MEIVSLSETEDYNPQAESAALRVTGRSQKRQTWRTRLRIGGIGSGSWPDIKRNFTSTGMDFHDVVWARNRVPEPGHAAQLDGQKPAWPVICTSEEETWTLLDTNRKHPDRGAHWQLVKTGEQRSGGEAQYFAGFTIEMVRAQSASGGGDEPEPVALTPGGGLDPEPVPLSPYSYNLSAGVSGFMVQSSISGVSRSYDPELNQWSETRTGPPQTGGGIVPFEHHVRYANGRDGLLQTQLKKPGLSAALVEQLVTRPQSVTAPLKITGVLTEIEHESDAPDAAVLRRRITTTTVSLRFESHADVAPASLNRPADALTRPGNPARGQ